MDHRWEVGFLNAWHYAEWAEVPAAGAKAAEDEALSGPTRRPRVRKLGRPGKAPATDEAGRRQAREFATTAG